MVGNFFQREMNSTGLLRKNKSRYLLVPAKFNTDNKKLLMLGILTLIRPTSHIHIGKLFIFPLAFKIKSYKNLEKNKSCFSLAFIFSV